MNFRDLKPLTVADRDLYQKYFQLSKTKLADSCFNSRIAWDAGYGYRWFEAGECLCTVSDGGLFTDPHMYLPIGNLTTENLQKILPLAMQLFKNEQWDLQVLFIDEEYRDVFAAVPNYEIKWDCDEAFSDYLYDAENLRQLKGKNYRQKRNHVNKFLREYSGYTYRKLCASDREQAVSLTRTWCIDKDVDCRDITASDLPAIRTIFDNFEQLDIKGGAILIDEQIIAFAIGSQLCEEYGVIHFEKAHPDYDGLYSVINQWVLQEEFPTIKYVNREEDMGIEGIRTAKESYWPVRKLKKMRALIKERS